MRGLIALLAAAAVAYLVWSQWGRDRPEIAVAPTEQAAPPAPAEPAGGALRDAAESTAAVVRDTADAGGEAASGAARQAVEAAREAADAVGERAGDLRREIESLVDEATGSEATPTPPAAPAAPAN